MTWIPEFIVLIFAVSFPIKTAIEKQTHVPYKYVLLIFVYVAHILMGFLLNEISSWTMLAGFRIYTKFLPIFLLPLIYPLSQKAFRNLLLWIYALTMIQLPVVLWQRFFLVGFVGSGDPVGGTLGVTAHGILAIYLISVISFFIAFYFREEISLPVFLASAAVAFIPITMNSTKISSVMLPIAFIFPAFFIRGKRNVIIKVLFSILLMIFALIVYRTVFNYFQKPLGRPGIVEFWTNEARLREYNRERIIPLTSAFTVAPREDMRFAIFGRGAGNVSEGFTKILSGKYLNELYYYKVVMTLPKLIWEVGFLGAFLFYMFPILVFFDAVKLCRESGIPGSFALGTLSFTVFFVGSTAYTFTIDSNVLIFLYFFVAGLLVRLSVEAETQKSENFEKSTDLQKVFHTAGAA
ncbi:MAG: hypothetical protein K9K63_00895 [Desulfotignum sp.]|nr:hypothetical protein [Desulfotignum sp.]MCF8086448.1 hypothetical protein [Desulfotignum sp.]MCF8135850.1 hypothetical protein [Desulfotignum sp.]